MGLAGLGGGGGGRGLASVACRVSKSFFCLCHSYAKPPHRDTGLGKYRGNE